MFQYTPVDATFQAQGPIMLTSNAMTMQPNGQVTVSAPAVAQARQPANNATMMASQVTSPALTQACQASNNATTMASKVTSQAPAVAQARQPANNATMMASQVTSPAPTQARQASNNATTMASKVTSQAPAAVSNYVSPLPLTATLCESNVLQTG
jgi:hypothetical protein